MARLWQTGQTAMSVSPLSTDGPAQMIRTGTWYNEQLAAFLDRLEAVREGDCSLLDQTVVFHTTEPPHQPAST